MKIQFAFGNPTSSPKKKSKRSKTVAKKKKKARKPKKHARKIRRKVKRKVARKTRRKASRPRRKKARKVHRKARAHKRRAHGRKSRRGKRRNPWHSVTGWKPVPGREAEFPKQKKIGFRGGSYADEKETAKILHAASVAKVAQKAALARGDKKAYAKYTAEIKAAGAGASKLYAVRGSVLKKVAAVRKAHPDWVFEEKIVEQVIAKAAAKPGSPAKAVAKAVKAVKAAAKKAGAKMAKKKGKMTSHRHSLKNMHIEKGAKFHGVLKRVGKKKKGYVSKITMDARKNPRKKKRAKTYKHRHGKHTFHTGKPSRSDKSKLFNFKLKFNPGAAVAGLVEKAVPMIFGSEFGDSTASGGSAVAKKNRQQLLIIGVGGLATPLANYLASKIINAVNSYVPAISPVLNIVNSSGMAAPLGLLMVGRLVEEFNKRSAKSEMLANVSEGLVLSAAMGAAMILAQKGMAAAGLSGVLYTPTMGDVRYTAGPMGDVRYTPGPMGILPTMGVIPRGLSGGYGSGADFGKAADYGGSGGYTQEHKFSKADFGGMTMDEDADEVCDDSDISDENLAGSVG
jgi:hypothetical protein